MKKIAIVCLSENDNTKIMARAIAQGAKDANAEKVDLILYDDFSVSTLAMYDAIAFGCHYISNGKFTEHVFTHIFKILFPYFIETKVALFCSYDCNSDDTCMENLENIAKRYIMNLVRPSLAICGNINSSVLTKCNEFGAILVK